MRASATDQVRDGVAAPPRRGRLRPVLAPLGGAAATALMAAVCISVPAALAWWTDRPLVFPSLGPTIFLALTSPFAEPSCPRNTLLGHLVSAAAGYAALVCAGLTRTPPDLLHPDARRILAVAIALGLTCAGMAAPWTRHPPGGATTLIVALGLLRTPAQLLDLMAAIVLTSALLVVLNRLAGRPCPWWRPSPARREGRPERTGR
ncbi:HPP family protein [Actinomadura rugatobispora]|uniref:HPP family protein n=1 Tax=Actinomadura rugatobispora TaxID=1994 RepID=A0ABW0ZR76_9ACTN|nr:HPP family protein [Actinomadura rugatobispora]